MSPRIPLQNEDAVVSAVRRFLQDSIEGLSELEAMAAVVSVTSQLPLRNLDSWERTLREELWKIHATPPVRWKIWKKSTRSISWLDLCSGDGFWRERTLRELSGRAPNRFFLALALRRLNDWVPQVRAAAREHLFSIANCSDPEDVVDALWTTLSHCNTWARMEDADRQVLSDLISIEHVAVAFKSRIVSAVAGPTTTVLAQVGRAPTLDRWLSEIASNAIQPSVRAKAYRSQLEGRMIWFAGRKWAWTDVKWCKGRFEPVLGERSLSSTSPFLEVLKMALADQSPIVRRVGAELLIQQLGAIGAESFQLAERLASDRSPSVAERGQFALAQLRGKK